MRIIRYSYPNTRSFLPALGFNGRSPWAGLDNEISRFFAAVAPVSAQLPVEFDEDKDNTYVRAELPGVKREDINIETSDGYLTITASRKQKNGEAEGSFSVSRSVAVPEQAQADKVTAAYENGVLTVTFPKGEAAKPRKIAVN